MNRRLFCFWTGPNRMPDSRRRALDSLDRTGLDILLITPSNLSSYILDEAPLHSAFEKLSYVHRADYLRTYFMHFYGGAYSDIKFTYQSWTNAFETLIKSDHYICGYREISPFGVAHVGGLKYLKLCLRFKYLLGNGAYLCKPRTPFTSLWYTSLLAEMDLLNESLLQHPASHPEDYLGRRDEALGGAVSLYPVKWSQLLGSIFHPLCYQFRRKIIYTLPAPDFKISVDI
jgi:hypothetical protein